MNPTVRVEQKGIDSIPITNYLRIFVSSNEDWAVPIDPDDRRFVVLDLPDCHKQDQSYFAAIHTEMNSGGREALMYYLQHEDLQGFRPRDKPKPRFGFDMKVRSADSVTKWLYECLQSGSLVCKEGMTSGSVSLESDGEWESSWRKDMIDFAYRTWCRRQNERYPEAVTVLFKRLVQHMPKMRVTRPNHATNGTRPRLVTFPDLQQARLSFEKAMNAEGQIEWAAE